MAVENITLNLIPTGDKPSIHVAQFDVDRAFTVTLKEGEDDFTPTGYDIELQVRKVDNNIVTSVPSEVSGNVVTFNTTEQMAACSGTNLAELQLTKDSKTFATLHFYLVVQRDVLAGGLTSQSEIYDLEEQIAAIVPQVIGDDYYTAEEVDEKIAEIPTFDPTNYYDKSDVDTLLNGKADVSDLPDMTNYYDKSETDALLDNKADVSDLPDMSNYYDKSDVDALLDNKADVSDLPDMSNYYDKSDVDALLDDKADVSDLPNMTDYYTKSEVDTKITDLYQIKTASGSIVHITDGGNAIPVKSLVSEIVAVESGSGEKSPDNPYTISGFDNGVVSVCGKNLIVGKIANCNINAGGYLGNSTEFNMYYAYIKQGITYTITNNESSVIGGYFNSIPTLGSTSYDNSRFTNLPNTFTSTFTGYIAFRVLNSFTNAQIEVGSPTTYEAYKGNTYTFAFGQTVYGGHFDNKGNLVVTHGIVDLSTLTWVEQGVGSGVYRATNFDSSNIDAPTGYTDTPDLIAENYVTSNWETIVDGHLTNAITVRNVGSALSPDIRLIVSNSTPTGKMIYKLKTPTSLSITSQDIPTLLGENNFFSNCGDVEVKYFTEKSDGIAELIKAFM